MARTFGTREGISEINFANQMSPGSSAVAPEVVLLGLRQTAHNGCSRSSAFSFLASLSAGLVAVIAAIADDLLPLFGNMSGQGGERIQGGKLLWGWFLQLPARGCSRLVGDDARVALVMEPGQREGRVNKRRGFRGQRCRPGRRSPPGMPKSRDDENGRGCQESLARSFRRRGGFSVHSAETAA